MSSFLQIWCEGLQQHKTRENANASQLGELGAATPVDATTWGVPQLLRYSYTAPKVVSGAADLRGDQRDFGQRDCTENRDAIRFNMFRSTLSSACARARGWVTVCDAGGLMGLVGPMATRIGFAICCFYNKESVCPDPVW